MTTNTNHITLYIDSNYSSPYAMFAYIALKEKGLPFDLKQINIREKHHQVQAYQAISLTVKIPALIHDGFTLAESSAIIEYLEEVFPAPAYPAVLPQEVHQRARARQVQAWIRSDLLTLRQDRPTTVIFEAPIQQPLSEGGLKDAEKLIAVASSLIDDQANNLFGEWCIADAELALTLNRLVANGDVVPEKLKRYVQRQWDRPSVQSWLKHER